MPFDPDYTQPLVQQGSFGAEYQFQKDAALSVSYLADKGMHLQRYRDVNLGTPGTPITIGIAGRSTVLTFTRFTLPRPIAGFDRILLFESNANSIYHGPWIHASRVMCSSPSTYACSSSGKRSTCLTTRTSAECARRSFRVPPRQRFAELRAHRAWFPKVSGRLPSERPAPESCNLPLSSSCRTYGLLMDMASRISLVKQLSSLPVGIDMKNCKI